MSDASDAVSQLNTKMDKALATVLATPSADDRYFIGEALLIGTLLFVLNRYAGAYLDELGLKALAKDHAEATRQLLASIHSKTVTDADIDQQKDRLDRAFVAIRTHGASAPAERAAEQRLLETLIEAGAMNLQAQRTAREAALIVHVIVSKSE